jgi:hypothetical protein
LDGEQFLQELRTLSPEYAVWDDELITFTANVTTNGRCFVYFHLKKLPWTKDKIAEVDVIFSDILDGLKDRGIGEVYTMIKDSTGGTRLAPHFGFEQILRFFISDKGNRSEYTIFKQEII